jgi:phosphoglycolate phosphatase
MLILFDIDATLINTSRSGILALHQAGIDHFGPTFAVDGTDFAGRLDPLIIRDLLINNGLPVNDENRRLLREGYKRHLSTRLETPGVGRALPGVMRLLEELERVDAATLGLLTGNFADTGSLKLRACGIDPARFALAVWGDQSPHDPPSRDHLPPIALDRDQRRRGRRLPAEKALIIGDTPHDVRCAKVSGMRCLAVATGSYTVDQLDAAGADRAVADLSETDDLTRWIFAAGSRP